MEHLIQAFVFDSTQPKPHNIVWDDVLSEGGFWSVKISARCNMEYQGSTLCE